MDSSTDIDYLKATQLNQFRPANKNDSNFLVPLVAISSGGVWPAVWKALAYDGETVEASGARYLTNPLSDLSVDNTILAESNVNPIGAMIRYREKSLSSNEPESHGHPPLPRDLINALQPYRELSDPDSLFIAELCLLPEARGQGFGSRFLEYAREEADAQGLPRITLRVFSDNVGAVRLYERSGFEISDQRPVVRHPDIKVAGSVLLMSCKL